MSLDLGAEFETEKCTRAGSSPDTALSQDGASAGRHGAVPAVAFVEQATVRALDCSTALPPAHAPSTPARTCGQVLATAHCAWDTASSGDQLFLYKGITSQEEEKITSVFSENCTYI